MTLPLRRLSHEGHHLVPRDAPAWPAQRVPGANPPGAAPASPVSARVAFCLASPAGEAGAAPHWPAAPHRWGDWQIPEAAAFVLRLVCAFHGESPSSVLARLIADEGRAIGLSPALARHYGEDAFAGHANSPDGDFRAVPDFTRIAASRFARR